jgi:hypothetical protein
MMYLGTFVFATLELEAQGSYTVCACIMGDTVSRFEQKELENKRDRCKVARPRESKQ